MTLKQYSGMAVVSQKLSESTARMWTPQRPPERNRDLQTSRQSQKSESVETKEAEKELGCTDMVWGLDQRIPAITAGQSSEKDMSRKD